MTTAPDGRVKAGPAPRPPPASARACACHSGVGQYREQRPVHLLAQRTAGRQHESVVLRIEAQPADNDPLDPRRLPRQHGRVVHEGVGLARRQRGEALGSPAKPVGRAPSARSG